MITQDNVTYSYLSNSMHNGQVGMHYLSVVRRRGVINLLKAMKPDLANVSYRLMIG